MCKCVICKKEVEVYPEFGKKDYVLLNSDGDFACSKECAEKYEKEKEYFFNVILRNDKLYANWLGVSESFL